MSVDYDKLTSTDYTAHEHMRDFRDKLWEHGIFDPLISVDSSYDQDVPVVDARGLG